MSRFQKATRKQLKLRLALCGPTGSGKTRTALRVAKYLGKRVAVIDTENRSASKYVGLADVPDFDVLELDSYAPRTYVDAIKEAEREGYDVIIVDGITQAWSGKDGALEMVDKAAKRSNTGNSFTAWRDVTPHHNALVDALVHCKAHLITTMRAKTEWVLEENDRGKKVPRKVGMAPEQRSGLEFEFDVVGDLDVDHNLLVSKTRCDALDGGMFNKPGQDFAETLKVWLGEGEVDAERPLERAATQSAPSAERPRTAATGARVSETTGATSAPVTSGSKVDEYQLAIPSAPCPVVAQGKPNAGKRWDELPGGLLQKMRDEARDRMNADQTVWIDYLVKRRAARKAAEAFLAEQEAAERALAADDTGIEEPGAGDLP